MAPHRRRQSPSHPFFHGQEFGTLQNINITSLIKTKLQKAVYHRCFPSYSQTILNGMYLQHTYSSGPLHRHTCSCQCVCCAHAHQHMHWSQKDVRCPAPSLLTLFPQKGSLSECRAKLVAKQAPVILLSQPHTVLGFQASMPQSKQIVFLIYRWICLCVWMDPSCSNTHVKVRGYLVARLPLLSCWF